MRPRCLPNILSLTKEILRKAVSESVSDGAAPVSSVSSKGTSDVMNSAGGVSDTTFRSPHEQGACVAVDATAGNGHDTLFLAQLVTEASQSVSHAFAHVYAFDVQQQAVENTRNRVAGAGYERCVTVFHAGHETLRERIPAEYHGGIAVATYNLGYLPGSDKQTITRSRTTIDSLEQLLPMMRLNGVVSVHIYTGHEGGPSEGEAVLRWAQELDWKAFRVGRYDFPNKMENKEILLVIERLA